MMRFPSPFLSLTARSNALSAAMLLVAACSASSSTTSTPHEGNGGAGGSSSPDESRGGGGQETPAQGGGGSAITIQRTDSGNAATGSGNCLPGTYSGNFTGGISLLGIQIPSTLAGTVTLTLQSKEVGGGGEFSSLAIADGKVEGEDTDHNPYKADLKGSLNCQTGKLENAELVNGEYTRTLGTPQTFKFHGPMTADYQISPPALIHGTWGPMVEMSGIASGSGMWSAQHK